jgi:uncharacterized protein YjdB
MSADTRIRSTLLPSLVLLSLVLLVACSGMDCGSAATSKTDGMSSDGMSNMASLGDGSSITVSPESTTMQVGQTRSLEATVRNSSGEAVVGSYTLAWSSSNQSVATVSNDGSVTSIGIGSAIITVALENTKVTVSITVVETTVSSITVSPQSMSLTVGQTQKLTGNLVDARGGVITGQPAWESSSRFVATVSASGLVSAVGPGTATVNATAYGQQTTAVVTVIEATIASVTVAPEAAAVSTGQTKQMSASITDTQGSILVGLTPSWSSSKMSVATVSTDGLITAVASGTTTITVTSGGVMGTATVTVAAVPVSSIIVSPQSPKVVAGQTQQLVTTLRDASGNTLTGQTVTWSSSNQSAATVSASGFVAGIASGTSTITATVGGSSAVVLITVTEAQVVSVAVTPTLYVLKAGETLQLTVTLSDGTGNELTGPTVTWSSSDPLIATVSTKGLVKSEARGSATVTATAEGVSKSVDIEVVDLE